jgi:hypothetical protein
MDQGALVTEETDAGEELVCRFDKFASVKAAFWLKEAEERQWYLYIASDQINDTNLRAAYGEILRVAAQMVTPYLDPFRVKLIPTSNPLAQAAVEIHQRYPGRIAIRLNGTNFGGLSVDGVFIYPACQNVVTP